MAAVGQPNRSSKGWKPAMPDGTRLVASTIAGSVSVELKVQETGRRIMANRNPDGTWTTLGLDEHGRLTAIARGRTKAEARAAFYEAEGPR
jgi:hypothetical protein